MIWPSCTARRGLRVYRVIHSLQRLAILECGWIGYSRIGFVHLGGRVQGSFGTRQLGVGHVAWAWASPDAAAVAPSRGNSESELRKRSCKMQNVSDTPRLGISTRALRRTFTHFTAVH